MDNRRQTTDKLIVALDVPTAGQAREVVAELKDLGVGFKIGLQLFTVAGAEFVRELVAQDARVFLDLKFHDIPNTVASAAVEAARLGVWMFNVHAVGGGEMMRRTIEAVQETASKESLRTPKIIAVTVLTSAVQETLREVNITAEPLVQVVQLTKLTAECGLNGVVASPQEVRAIREQVERNDFLIVTPGIRPEVETSNLKFVILNDDQKRTLTAREAIAAGSSHIVVGRPILQAVDRTAATIEILRQTANA